MTTPALNKVPLAQMSQTASTQVARGLCRWATPPPDQRGRRVARHGTTAAGHTIILGKLYAKDSALRRGVRLGLGRFLFFPPSVGACGVWRHACGLPQIPEVLSIQDNPFLLHSSLREHSAFLVRVLAPVLPAEHSDEERWACGGRSGCAPRVWPSRPRSMVLLPPFWSQPVYPRMADGPDPGVGRAPRRALTRRIRRRNA